MYNKIASIILNLAKAPGSGAVYVSQPDAEREKIAGKLFVLAEIEGKKNDIDKLIDFIIEELEENYYHDEKILLIGKLEGLKIENIFEAALAKTNKSLNEFIKDHKIKLDPGATDLSVGVICGSKIHFSSFGRNRSLLIYRRADGYEIINVDTEAKTNEIKDNKKAPSASNIFSSVISGEVPLGSYFIFASESLPEYISGLELVKIITKLPPIVAAEQIKNVLAKINNYVPFLGIIIKNTNEDPAKKLEDIPSSPRSAHNSISSLSHTEKKTEHMLAPAGLINITSFKRTAKALFDRVGIKLKQRPSKVKTEPADYMNASKKSKMLNLPNSSSFLKPPKVFLKKSSSNLMSGLKSFLSFIPKLFSPKLWQSFFKSIIAWFKGLNRKNAFLFASLIIVFVVMTFSITNLNKQKKEKADLNNFNIVLNEIKEKEALIDSFLLYDNSDGAINVLNNIESLVESMPDKKDYQVSAKEELIARITNLQDKILGIKRIDKLESIATYPDIDLKSIIKTKDKLYANSDSSIFTLDLNNNESDKLDLDLGQIEASRLSLNAADKEELYFFSGDKVSVLNPKDNSVKTSTLANYNKDDSYSSFDTYNNKLYLLSSAKNQIYSYSSDFKLRTDWFKEDVDTSSFSDIYIDGDIYALNISAKIAKYRRGASMPYESKEILPQISNAKKLRGDNKNLYVLADDNRFLIINKENGKLASQYIFSDLNIIDFSLDSDSKNVLFLAGDQIYSFPL